MARQNGTKDDITDSQQAAITALLAGQTTEQAAAAAGVTRQTVSEWRNHDTAFQLAYNRQRREVLQTALDALRAAGLRAVATLTRDLESEQAADRARAAAIILKTWAALKDETVKTGDTSAGALLLTKSLEW
jgi:transcriptional regulator with XRE-family HTH domain